MTDQTRGQPRPSPWSRASTQAAAVLLVCLLVYVPGLNHAGLAYTEGHRAIPGFELLERLRAGDFSPTSLLVTTLFEQPYMRKPPGMPWAVALAASVLGEGESAPRAVSAAASAAGALLALWMARRWFGAPWGLVAGLFHALTPLFWQAGRSGEIEALNNLFTQAAVFALIDAARRARPAPMLLAASAAVLGLAWTKGPASIPCIVSASLAALWLAPPAARPRLALALFVALAAPMLLAAGLWAYALRLAAALDRPPVTQGVGEFLWTLERAPRVLALPFLAWASALPAALALLWPWGPDARREGQTSPQALGTLRLARALAGACLGALLIYAALGVSNPRYTMPAFTFIAPLVAYLARGRAGEFLPLRARLAGLALLGRPWAWPVVLLAVAAVVIPLTERSRARNSGRAAGESLAQAVHTPSDIHADLAIEARPEVLWYAARASARRGLPLRPLWNPGWTQPPTGLVLLLDSPDEEARLRARPWSLDETPLATEAVAGFRFMLTKPASQP